MVDHLPGRPLPHPQVLEAIAGGRGGAASVSSDALAASNLRILDVATWRTIGAAQSPRKTGGSN